MRAVFVLLAMLAACGVSANPVTVVFDEMASFWGPIVDRQHIDSPVALNDGFFVSGDLSVVPGLPDGNCAEFDDSEFECSTARTLPVYNPDTLSFFEATLIVPDNRSLVFSLYRQDGRAFSISSFGLVSDFLPSYMGLWGVRADGTVVSNPANWWVARDDRACFTRDDNDGCNLVVDPIDVSSAGYTDLIRAEFYVPTPNSWSAISSITTSVVPVPAAVWLFGSALFGLGYMRRR